LAAADEAERPVPKFVRREFDAFLDCGLIEKGRGPRALLGVRLRSSRGVQL